MNIDELKNDKCDYLHKVSRSVLGAIPFLEH